MDDLSVILYVCVLLPIILSLFILEGRARLVVGFILLGMTICLYVSYMNTIICNALGESLVYYTTTVSPILEEVAKAIPILIYAFVFSNDRKSIIHASFSVGLGFAVLENLIILTQNIGTVSVDVPWAFARGFGAGLMHGVCTVAVGLGISFVKNRKKFFYCGTLSLLMLAITYHAIYNVIVLSSYRYFGFALPLATYIPILFCLRAGRRVQKKNDQK